MKETDVAAKVIAYLKDLRYEVHQEVGADIVALLDGRAWIIECKLSLGLSVLAQAYRWVRDRSAAYVSIATPVFRHSDRKAVAEWYLRYHGIGWLTVVEGDPLTSGWSGEYPVRELLPARVQRMRKQPHWRDGTPYFPHDIRRCLSEHSKDYEIAGTPAPRAWTPFKETCERVRAALKEGPPLTVREIVDRVEHHYASPSGARSRLSHYLSHGVIEGVEPFGDGRPQRWQLGPPPPEAP